MQAFFRLGRTVKLAARPKRYSATFADLRRYLGPEIQQYLTLDAAMLEERRIAVSLARLKYQAALSRKERAGDRASPEIIEAVRATSAALDEAHEQLLQFPARSIAPYEPAELLDRALETTTSNLLISSRTLDRSVVDARFLKRLDELLAGGTRVSIALSEHTAEGPVAEIEKLRTRYPRLEVSLGKRVFDEKGVAREQNRDAELTKLHAKIGQLVVERDFLAKAFDR
jgi:hypothetical protein